MRISRQIGEFNALNEPGEFRLKMDQVLVPASLAPRKPPRPPSESEIMAGWTNKDGAPLVTIICLTYNHAAFVSDALHGFLIQQTTFPFEIVVQDDASGDGTQRVIAAFADRYPCLIRPILQATNQFSSGVNVLETAFAAARGRYIAYCEGDDYWIDPRKLHKQVAFLEENPAYAVCYTDSIAFAGDKLLERQFGGACRDLTPAELQRGTAIYTLTACFRNLVEFPPEFTLVKYGDVALWSLLGQHGAGKFLADVEPSFYRVHADGLHSASGLKRRSQLLMQTSCALFAYYERTGNKELAEHYCSLLARMSVASIGVSPRLLPAMRIVSKAARRIKGLIGQ